MNLSRRTSRISEVILWLLSLVILIPIYYVVANSLKSSTEVQLMTAKWPTTFHFDNYAKVWNNGNMPRAFLNSAIYSFFSIILTSLLAAMASYVIVRRKSVLNKAIFNIFMVGMIAPINMVTTFKMMKMLHFVNSYTGMILLYSGLFLPFTIFLYNGFIGNLPTDMDEAATVDGAGPLRRFFTIVYPLLLPVTVTGLVINFVNCWNDFMFPLYFITQTEKWGIVLLLFQYTGMFTSQHELLLAGAMMVAIPTLIVYALGQKYIISGMTAGAVKG